MRHRWIWEALTLLEIVDITRSCSCIMPRYHNSFCRADFAISANVTGSELYFRNGMSLSALRTSNIDLDPGQHQEYNYTIDILDVYKQTPLFDMADKMSVYSDAFWGSCGIELTEGVLYYLAGFVRNGKLHVSSCLTSAPMSELTRRQLAGIRRKYAANCECRVEEFLSEIWDDKRVCRARWYSQCEEKRAFCVKRRRRCVWRYGKGQQLCVEEEEI